MPTGFGDFVHGRIPGGISTKCSCRSTASACICGERWIAKARCWISWSNRAGTRRMTNATLQVARISATISFYTRRRLQQLQRPASFDFPKNITPVPWRCHERMAGRNRCRLTKPEPAIFMRLQFGNVTTPARVPRCKRRSNSPSVKRPGIPVAPE